MKLHEESYLKYIINNETYTCSKRNISSRKEKLNIFSGNVINSNRNIAVAFVQIYCVKWTLILHDLIFKKS
jgi:hypothetical protein